MKMKQITLRKVGEGKIWIEGSLKKLSFWLSRDWLELQLNLMKIIMTKFNILQTNIELVNSWAKEPILGFSYAKDF